jgi:hypothetical protein
MRIPLYVLAAAVVVAILAGAVYAWLDHRADAEIEAVLPLERYEEIPHPPP